MPQHFTQTEYKILSEALSIYQNHIDHTDEVESVSSADYRYGHLYPKDYDKSVPYYKNERNLTEEECVNIHSKYQKELSQTMKKLLQRIK